MNDKSAEDGLRMFSNSVVVDGKNSVASDEYVGEEIVQAPENVIAFNDKALAANSGKNSSAGSEFQIDQIKVDELAQVDQSVTSTDYTESGEVADTDIVKPSEKFELNWPAVFWLLLFVIASTALIYTQYHRFEQFQSRSSLLNISSELDSDVSEIRNQALLMSGGKADFIDALSKLNDRVEENLSKLRVGNDLNRYGAQENSKFESLVRVEQSWHGITPDIAVMLENKDAIDNTMGKVRRINQLTTQLLVKTDEIVEMLIDQQASLTLINIANRQRILTQRMKASMNEFATGNAGWEVAIARFGQDVKLFGQINNTMAYQGDEMIAKHLNESENLYNQLFATADSIMSNIGSYFTLRNATDKVIIGSAAVNILSRELHQNLKNTPLEIANLTFANVRNLLGVLGGVALFSLCGLVWSIYRYSKKQGATIATTSLAPDPAAIKLFSDMSPIVNGDLSKDVQVTQDITGAIANSINLLAGKFRVFISETISATEQIQVVTDDTLAYRKNLISNSEIQSQNVGALADDIASMNVAILDIGVSATEARDHGHHASELSQLRINVIRDTLRAAETKTAEAFQKNKQQLAELTHKTQHMDGMAKLIKNLKDDIELLSVNLSINTTKTENSGPAIATVAQEMQTLLEQSAHASKETDRLVRDLKTKIADAAATVESTKTVIMSDLIDIDTAQQFLGDNELINENIPTAINKTIESVDAQALKFQAVIERVNSLRESSSYANLNLSEVVQALTQLQEVTERLQQSIEGFKLPTSN